jgi:hypothetical protein
MNGKDDLRLGEFLLFHGNSLLFKLVKLPDISTLQWPGFLGGGHRND